MKEISVEELATWRASGKPFVLVDVRTPRELELATLPGSLHVALQELPVRMHELDRDAEIAVICHTGSRSAFVTELLARGGFGRVYNVTGGIDAYSTRVDRSIPRY